MGGQTGWRAAAILVLALLPVTVLAQTAPAPPVPAPAVAPVTIDGFRSARFGMTEAQVRAAIESDFKLSGAAVHRAENAVQRTPALSITVRDLVPDSGKAAVDYVFGYKGKRLIEINVTWSATTDPAIKPEMLLRTGETLQAYFQGETFPENHAVSNAMLPNHSLILFRGEDAADHTVVLILAGPVEKPASSQEAAKPTLHPRVLTLVYAADPRHPDVFHLEKGAF